MQHVIRSVVVMAKYQVAKGIDYLNKRAEPGDVVNDLPTDAIDWLLAIDAITPVVEKRGK